MIRDSPRTNRTLLLAGTLLAIAALLATAGVAGAQTAPTDGTTAAETTAVAQDDETVELEVTKKYHRTPDNTGNVTVEYIVRNPEIVDRSDVDEVILDTSDATYVGHNPLIDYDGFERLDEDRFRLKGTGDTARLHYHETTADIIGEFDTEEFATFVPDNLLEGEDVIVDATTDWGTTVEPAFTYDAGDDGFVTSGNSDLVSRIDHENVDEYEYFPRIVMGNYEPYSETRNGRTVELIVPADVELRSSPSAILDSTAGNAERLDAGNVDGTRYLIAANEIMEPGSYNNQRGYTTPKYANWALVRGDQPVHYTGTTWSHEWVHTTDEMDLAFDKEVDFHEGWAEYRALESSLESGIGSYDRFRLQLLRGQVLDVDDDEFGGEYIRKQDWGKYFDAPSDIAGLDYQIRQASDGQYTVHDVVDDLSARDDSVDREEFNETVKQYSNETVADRFDSWFFEEEGHPQTHSLQRYQDVYGAVPNVTQSVSEVRVVSDRGEHTVDTEGPLAVRAGSTVEFDVTIDNTGLASGQYKVELREADHRPVDDRPPTVYDEATGQVAGEDQTTVTVSRTVTETGTEEIDVGQVVPDDFYWDNHRALANPYTLTVVEEDAAIVRENGRHDSRDTAAIVTDDASEIVFQSEDPESALYWARNKWAYTDEHGIFRASPEEWLDPGDRKLHRFEYYGESYYVSSLEPVNGTIPKDLDDDGKYMDVNGDGQLTDADVDEFFQHQHRDSVKDYVPAYDYAGDGDVDHGDVIVLQEEVGS